mmetsp:Transcript_11860/g.1784  ORF Transcript_11860/g.1784 Transcript_11860/m.1784 type:complete len:93 (-) Transcript_11860:141-419(-)
MYSDCEAAFWFLAQVLKVPYEKIILYGISIGSRPSCYLAERNYGIGGLILQCPTNSMYDNNSDTWYYFNENNISNVSRIKRIVCPLLVIVPL